MPDITKKPDHIKAYKYAFKYWFHHKPCHCKLEDCERDLTENLADAYLELLSKVRTLTSNLVFLGNLPTPE